MKKALLAIAAAALAPQLAWAHAHLDKSTPAAHSAVASPASISATFTERLEPAFSSLSVAGADGKAVDLGKAALDPDDGKTLVLKVGKPLPPADYKVTWKVLSKDGHKTNGQWAFTVKP